MSGEACQIVPELFASRKKKFFKENRETGNYENMNPIRLLFLKEFVNHHTKVNM